MIAVTYAGLRWGEAPARSSLVPRDLTAEFVFDASRFARALYALRRSLLVVVEKRSLFCLLKLCLV